jgi:hypothetical protein
MPPPPHVTQQRAHGACSYEPPHRCACAHRLGHKAANQRRGRGAVRTRLLPVKITVGWRNALLKVSSERGRFCESTSTHLGSSSFRVRSKLVRFKLTIDRWAKFNSGYSVATRHHCTTDFKLRRGRLMPPRPIGQDSGRVLVLTRTVTLGEYFSGGDPGISISLRSS